MLTHSYLGQKGYTLLKSDLTAQQLSDLKGQLTIRPFTPGAPVASQVVFLVYRENNKKIYIPRFFGLEQFGPPVGPSQIPEGVDIDVPFTGVLRDYQTPILNAFLHHVHHVQPAGLLELPCAWGKTSGSLFICSQLRKKTIVIVHKGFLMDQWIERIQQFMPTARIGKIQGPIVDIENKDIVLCMLQSLVQKEYPASLFDSFGFTIIDEVHHISSEHFSNALFKLVTKYMMGLSATMTRKDGTTHVFKMFLGPVVQKVERKGGTHQVQVRAIMFKSADPEFNETLLDFRGKPQMSSMIVKLCSYTRRTEFIVRLLTDFIVKPGLCSPPFNSVPAPSPKLQTMACWTRNNHLRHKWFTRLPLELVRMIVEMMPDKPRCRQCQSSQWALVKNVCCATVQFCLTCAENMGKKCPCCQKKFRFEQNVLQHKRNKPVEEVQILVLAHNLNILKYIYEKMVCFDLASVGYYVGGMKAPALEKSAKQQIILATYAMASEGLDIPTINAEFLITPKTDIVQSVGRVLRAKHAFADPIIYDIVDPHDVFRRQWLRRRAFYRSNHYEIVTCSSDQYKGVAQFEATKMEENDVVEAEEDEEEDNPVPFHGCLLKFPK